MPLSSEDIQQLGNLPDAQTQKIPLAPGDDAPESRWRNLYNLRLEVDGQYVYWKTRGGSTLVNSFFGNVLTIYPFQIREDGVIKEYLAVHTAAGHCYLWDIAGASSNQIASNVFSTAMKVQFAHFGHLLYIFDYDSSTARYYDVTEDQLSPFLSYNKSYIHNANFFHVDFEEQNIFDYDVGQQIIVFPNETGEPNFVSYESKIDTISEVGDKVRLSFKDPDGNDATAVLGGIADSEIENANIVFPHTADTEDLIGEPSSKQSDGQGGTQANDKYSTPSIYRQYVIIDMLGDGSVTIAGKPYQVEMSVQELLQDGAGEVRLSVRQADSKVVKRFLCCTRWHDSAEGAFVPSSSAYPNSPLFIAKEVDPQSTFVDDITPDSQLLRSINEIYPITAGVADLFASGQLSADSIAQFGGSLLMAGYRINRPTPAPYVDPTVATNENIFVDIDPTTQLPNDMALAFQFEYTDGKKSQIVETEHFLQQGFSSETEAVPCEQTKASGSHQVTQGTQEDGAIDITYDGVTTRVQLTVSSHSSPADVASAIQAAIANASDQRIDAALDGSETIKYTEKRWGESFNNNVVDVAAVPVAAIASIDVQSNSLSQTQAEGWLDVEANNIGSSSSESHQITIGQETTNAITINDTDTLEEIVDKYVNEINNGGQITTGWTASKVDNGDGTWRCLITSDTSDESDNGTTISVDNVDVTVTEQNAQGGNDGEETHTITIGGDTTGDITIQHTDGISDIAQKYVDKVNADGTISGKWTATLVDNGDGTWRCKLTSDNPGAADNGTTPAVNKSGTVSGGSQVSTTTADASGGSDGAGITFDNRDVTLSGASEPEGVAARAFVVAANNYLNQDADIQASVDGNDTGTTTVSPDDNLQEMATKLRNILSTTNAITQDWSISTVKDIEIGGTTYPGVEIVAKQKGTAWNGKTVTAGGVNTPAITFWVAAPGKIKNDGNAGIDTAGGEDPCTQATAAIDITANNLQGGITEDHVITVDGNSTDPITITDTDSLEDIADKYVAAIPNAVAIDIEWKAQKVDNGDGTWRCKLTFRSYGTTGNGRDISVSGVTDISLSISSPSDGGTDGGTVVSGDPVTQVNANRLQIHSLNQLVSDVFILGRTNDGSKTFHLIRKVSIDEAGAHGKVISLPNTESALDDIENTTYQTPSATEVLESIELSNYVNIGTPFQQFQISTQEQINDQSSIMRVVPVDYATEKTVMRYRLMIFTDQNIQMGYLVDSTQSFDSGRTRRTFDGDFEKVFSGLKATSWEGITDLLDQVVFPTENGVFGWPKKGAPTRLFNDKRYPVSVNNNLVDVTYKQEFREMWFLYGSNVAIVYDLDSQTTRRMEYSGVGNIRAGAFFDDKLYIGTATDVLETDKASATTDKSGGDAVTGKAESIHFGDELSQIRLMEIVVGGQQFSCAIDVDLQSARFEDGAGTWSDQFQADMSLAAKTLKMHGASYQVQRMAIMPRIRLTFDATSGGRLAYATIKSQPTPNKGKARQ